jgi:imidazolonepropionase-like amidohydrolase
MTDERRWAIAGGTALLGPGLDVTPDAVVLVEGDSIVAAGSRDAVAIPDQVTLLDASGLTVLPGFIDAHVHIGLSDPGEVLRGGVTTVRDLAWPLEEISAMAHRSASGLDGPLILAAGPMLTVAGGYPITAAWAPEGTGIAITSTNHAQRTVDELAAAGLSIIKIALNPPAGEVLPSDLLSEIVVAAHDHGLKVTGHIHGLGELEKALDAGIDELAHMLMSPEQLPEHVIDRMVEKDVAIVPTLSIFPSREAPIAVDNLARFVDAGGQVVYGTDLGHEGPGPGIDGLEVTRMASAGLTVTDIIRSATVDAAAWLGLDRKGVLEPGRDADIVCVEGPIDVPSALTRVRHVVREGRAVS